MDTQATSPGGQSTIEPEPQGRSGPAHPTDPGSGPTHPGGSGVPHRELPEPPAGVEIPAQPHPPGFRERGRMRRRARFLRKARELAYRDLGGLVFEMQRLGQRHDELVAAKLSVLASFDGELHALEAALGERRQVTVLHEAGIAACPRCAAIHGSDDRFCPMCGMPMGSHADRPIAATPPAVTGAPAAAPAIPPAPTVSPAQLPLSPPPAASPAAAEEDRPTEIIHPQDDAR